ncbi:3-methyladenine DNA glycosylase AlkC [Pseudovibrio denitrificans]|uniref:3-methyladenine DNA glycosylase AlkC n=1 Tax=Pseudovibrio denitrificans TaxID=258256 RepID=A0A1I7DWQ9_9HYPH|nr:DNA alkylation repair protein [Pseudovibrio denitrificans]SFU16118.1 3-methyladenine DNA glycosylase AlkC [Pseudovibrio denitrificans]
MAEPFKEVFNQASIQRVASALVKVHLAFDSAGFMVEALEGLSDLELKERSLHLARCLRRYLPEDYSDALWIMMATLSAPLAMDDEPVWEHEGDGLYGFITMPYSDYVLLYGLEHFELSMAAMKEMTSRFSAEFAIRAFIERYEDEAMVLLTEWAKDESAHVRRLVSEGTRPRLPWGQRLKGFIEAPEKCLPLLEALKDDETEYVRRSVANHLNDISKDHPDLTAEVCKRWMEEPTEQRKRMVRHALRSNVKAAHLPSLAVLGYDPEHAQVVSGELRDSRVEFGSKLSFAAEIANSSDQPISYMLDFVIYHRKANGTLAPKVFKWKRGELRAGQTLSVTGQHSMRPITTRRYYDGEHKLAVLLNGVETPVGSFDLVGVEEMMA